MDAQMNCRTLPSLEHAALIRTVVTLWNEDGIRRSLVELYDPKYKNKRRLWKTIEDRVIRNALQLPLPKSLKERILGLIMPTKQQLIKWTFHHNNAYFQIPLPSEICWTPKGTLDEKKIAELLIKDKNLHIVTRYKLACINCLKDDIPELWNEVPENCKDISRWKEDSQEVDQNELVVFWTYLLNGEMEKLNRIIEYKSWFTPCTPYLYAFECSATRGFKVATEYFLKELTSAEKERCLVRVARIAAKNYYDGYYSDILCFLLSQMSEEQQVEVFIKYPDRVLYCFLEWPRQEFFVEMAKRLRALLTGFDFDNFLCTLAQKIECGYKDYNYQNIFAEFWKQTPVTHKKYVLDKSVNGYLFSSLLDAGDTGNLKLILKDVSSLQKETFIFSDVGKRICERLIYKPESDPLKFFLQECISCKNTLIKFNEEFGKRVTAEKSSKFREIVDDIIAKYDKQKSVE